MTAFLAALQFLTVMPPLLRRPLTPQELGRAVGWFALVGLLLGGLLAGFDWLVELLWPPAIASALVLALWVFVTGALHLDGFLDTCDGLFGGNTAEERLRIMRDEHVGAFAVVGGVLLLLLKYAALTSVRERAAALALATTAGRWGMAIAVVGFPYGRKEGLGRTMKDHSGWREAILATVSAALAAWLVTAVIGLVALLAVALVVALGGWLALRRLPGLTGDIYGALCELSEVAVLLTVVAWERGANP